MDRCITYNVFHLRQFCRFFYGLAWYDTVEFNRLPCPNNKMYDDAVLADLIPQSIGYVWNSSFDRAISTPSFSYCIWIDTAKIIAAFLRITYFFMIWYRWIQSYAMVKQQGVRWDGFDNRFRYHLTTFEVFVLIELYRLVHTHIEY